MVLGEAFQTQALLRLSNGPFTRAQAEAHGLPAHWLGTLVRRGLVSQVLFGVYVVGAHPETVEDKAACLALALPSGAAASRRTAAWLWGVDARAPGEHTRSLALECTVPVGREPVRRPGLRCYVAPLDDEDLTDIGRVPVTTPLRTAVDLLRWLPPHMGLGAADALAHAGLLVPAHLGDEIERFRGSRGVAQARRLATLVDPRTESIGESWTKLRIADAGFPPPEPQIKLYDSHGREIYRLDMGYRHIRQAYEYDGEEFHTERPDRTRDAKRREHIYRDWKWQIAPVGKALILGPSLAFERGVGEALGMAPKIHTRLW
ncbi:type IV toxin-antitoxin system AbiEi family antitoxin [Spongisporangium articulatum]|uniref:Type IV toxin-antitoxin system AbiEi family antitoxin n=1 Tax=Spongisporangium articulatum TaxID=3362603 RepID=A0ABW8AMP3_9ACTN